MGEYSRPIIMMKYPIITLDKDIPVHNLYLLMFFYLCQILYILWYFQFRIIIRHVIPWHMFSDNPSCGATTHIPINSSDAVNFSVSYLFPSETGNDNGSGMNVSEIHIDRNFTRTFKWWQLWSANVLCHANYGWQGHCESVTRWCKHRNTVMLAGV